MKKNVLTLIIGLLISITAVGQSKAEVKAAAKAETSLEKLQASIELTDVEQAKYLEIATARFVDRSTWPKGVKNDDKAKFKELVKKNSDLYESGLVDAFGEKRAQEILTAGKSENSNKKNKKKKNK